MEITNLVLIGVAAVAILGALGAFTIAFRRSRTDEPVPDDWTSGVESDARRADRSTAGVRVQSLAEVEKVTVPEEPAPSPLPPEPEPEPSPELAGVAVVEAERVVEVSPEESGVTRRQFFNRALGATFAAWSAGLGLGTLAMLWPRVTGGFGADINVGAIADIESEVRTDTGEVVPLFIPEARTYLVPAPENLSEQFTDKSVAGGGLMALYQRCVHLGCRVPWCASSQGFECPCHGSKYNAVGEYYTGPAPRNLDRFVVEVTDSNDLVVKTGDIIQTPRAPIPSVEYPRGPLCVG